jgi:hypothetical protein
VTIKLSHAEGGEADSQRTRRATSRFMYAFRRCTDSSVSFHDPWGETAESKTDYFGIRAEQ